MNVVLLPSSIGGDGELQFLTSFMINDSVAVDAGSLGFQSDLAIQNQVRHVFLTHSHMDHLASLPVFLETVFSRDIPPPQVFALPEVWESIRKHLFNDILYPDFVRLSATGVPFLEWQPLVPGAPVQAGDLTLTPFPLQHAVPTLGFVIDDGSNAVAIVTDTGPTRAIWDECRKRANLRAVFLECAFPKSMRSLADLSGHLSTDMIASELAKAPPELPIYLVHIKPHHRPMILNELSALSNPRIHVCKPGMRYEF